VTALEAREPANEALGHYAFLGRLLTGHDSTTMPDDGVARAELVALLEEWRAHLSTPGLAAYGVTEAEIPAIVADSHGPSMKTNPIVLTDDEIAAILRASM